MSRGAGGIEDELAAVDLQGAGRKDDLGSRGEHARESPLSLPPSFARSDHVWAALAAARRERGAVGEGPEGREAG